MGWRGFGLVHHSIAILYHEVPNPNLTTRCLPCSRDTAPLGPTAAVSLAAARAARSTAASGLATLATLATLAEEPSAAASAEEDGAGAGCREDALPCAGAACTTQHHRPVSRSLHLDSGQVHEASKWSGLTTAGGVTGHARQPRHFSLRGGPGVF